jgi:hypothetical protein
MRLSMTGHAAAAPRGLQPLELRGLTAGLQNQTDSSARPIAADIDQVQAEAAGELEQAERLVRLDRTWLQMASRPQAFWPRSSVAPPSV